MNIALMGTGLIGSALAERLLESSHRLIVYNRTTSKTNALKEKGAHIAFSAQEAIGEAECIILALSDARAIGEVLFSGDKKSLTGRTVIQMGTVAPFESIEIQKKVFARGGEYFECPVLGSRKEAIAGSLILMVGATKDKFEKWQSLLKIFGPRPQLIGEVGKASAMKLALNQLIASHAVTFSLSLGIIQKNNINVEVFSEILRESALYAPMFDKKLSNWINQEYSNPNFSVKHLLKDVGLVIKESEDKNLDHTVVDAIEAMVIKAIDCGLEDKDYSSVFNVVNKIGDRPLRNNS